MTDREDWHLSMFKLPLTNLGASSRFVGQYRPSTTTGCPRDTNCPGAWGRHALGSQVFDDWYDESGWEVEHTAYHVCWGTTKALRQAGQMGEFGASPPNATNV